MFVKEITETTKYKKEDLDKNQLFALLFKPPGGQSFNRVEIRCMNDMEKPVLSLPVEKLKAPLICLIKKGSKCPVTKELNVKEDLLCMYEGDQVHTYSLQWDNKKA